LNLIDKEIMELENKIDEENAIEKLKILPSVQQKVNTSVT